jgi:hypothetical protein
MKNLILALVLAIICTSLFNYCSNANLSNIVTEIEVPEITLDVETDYKSLLLSFSKDSIPNYEDSGINFYIILNFSLSYYLSETPTHEVIETKIVYNITENGDLKMTHLDGDYILGIFYFDQNQKLYQIELPYNSSVTRSLKSWYACVNKQYKEYRDKIAQDAANDITCRIMDIVGACTVMNGVMAGIKCS